ncbi:Uncharacterised protein [Paenibacillus polymyxa]|nr:Uncharacterised protein [Paenibacillus polymyxa]
MSMQYINKMLDILKIFQFLDSFYMNFIFNYGEIKLGFA